MESRPNNTPLFITLLACIMAIAVAMIAAVFIAGQRTPIVVVGDREDRIAATEPRPEAPAPAPQVQPEPDAVEPEPEPQALRVARTAATPAIDDPFDPAWDDVPAIEVALEAQQMAPPRLQDVTISHVDVQAVHDGTRIAWRLSWYAPDPRSQVETGQYSDAVAIQIPLVDDAPYTMGAEDMPVRMLHWRAMWQKDIDEGFQDVHVLYPRAWVDLYWFAEGEAPFPLTEAFEDERSHEWLIPYRAGNPLADFKRDRPVEELVAEGFGTTTHVPDTPSNARGQWRDGRWTVVIDRPLAAGEALADRLLGEGEHAISLAVWDGAAGNVGGRKHYCTWVPMEIERR